MDYTRPGVMSVRVCGGPSWVVEGKMVEGKEDAVNSKRQRTVTVIMRRVSHASRYVDLSHPVTLPMNNRFGTSFCAGVYVILSMITS
jgi:hypothetical protein